MKKEYIEKIYNNIFKFIFIVLSVCFLTLYISNETGYFEYQQRQTVVLTDKKIKEFEEDVKKGINLDLESYLENSKKNYNNKASRTGLFLSHKIGEYTKTGIEKTFRFLNDLISDD